MIMHLSDSLYAIQVVDAFEYVVAKVKQIIGLFTGAPAKPHDAPNAGTPLAPPQAVTAA
jgi:hypothetical protein